MAQTRKLELVFTGDTSKLDRTFSRLGKSTSALESSALRAGKGIAKMAAIGGAALGGAFVVGMGKAIASASDLNESVSKATATFEKSAPAVLKWAEGASKSMGMTKAAALEGAASIGAMLKPMGIAPGAAAKMSTKLSELAADMGSFNNQDPTEMLERIRAGLSGESEPLKQFGAVLSETRVQQEAYRTGLAKTGEELTEQQKIQARYSLLLRDTKDQQGDFARTQGGVANQTRILKAQLGDLSAEVGTVLLPAATKGLAVLNGWVDSFRQHWPQIRPIVANALGTAKTYLDAVVNTVREHWPEIKATTQAAFEGARQAVAVAMDWIEGNVVPTIRAIVGYARGLWNRYGADIKAAFGDAVNVVKQALTAIRATIEFVLAVIRGDWGKAWSSLKTAVQSALGAAASAVKGAGRLVIVALQELARLALRAFVAVLKGIGGGIRSAIVTGLRGLGDLGTFLLNQGKALGKKIVDGIVDGIKSVPGRIRDAIGSAIPDSVGGIPIPTPWASGGFTPGPYTGRDPYLARLDGSEAILNPQQQARIPGGRQLLSRIFRETGGRNAGGFAKGGYASQAYSRAVGKLGTDYSYGKWDCSKFATYVAGVDVGGTTATAYAKSSRARGDEPIVWGFRRNGPGGYDGGRDEHMGIRVLGRWFDNGSNGVESNADSARWNEIRVPKGLENLEDTGTATAGAPGLTQFQQIRKLFAEAGVKAGGAAGAGAMARRVLGAIGERTTGVSDSLAGGSLSAREDRGVSAAGRKARTAARKAKMTPEEVAAAGEAAERKATVRFYRLHIRAIDSARRKLRAQKARILKDRAALLKMKKTADRKAAAKKLSIARATIDRELQELLELRAEANEELARLNEERIADSYDADYEAGGGGEEPATELDYLNAAAAQAGLTEDTADDLAAAQAIESYARRKYAEAVASGDPRAITDAANFLQTSIQNRQQIEATRSNTEALEANTAALEKVGGGSLAFGYRGQDYVLRSLAPPSSDRLESSLLGV